jgi:hypothetical protein
MNTTLVRPVERVLLVAVYGFVLLAPLTLIASVMKAGAQGPLVVLADALGFGAPSLLALQVVVSGRWAATTRSFGLRRVLSLHRQAGKALLVVVVLHVVVLLLDDPARLALLDPPTAPPRACWSARAAGSGGPGRHLRLAAAAAPELRALARGATGVHRAGDRRRVRPRGLGRRLHIRARRALERPDPRARCGHVAVLDAGGPTVRDRLAALPPWRCAGSAGTRSPSSSRPTGTPGCASSPGSSPGCVPRTACTAWATTRSRSARARSARTARRSPSRPSATSARRSPTCVSARRSSGMPPAAIQVEGFE